MALANYTDLKAAVATWLHRADLTSVIPDLIQLGELRLFREVRCYEMESALSSVIASGVIAVPSDYLELKSAYIDGSPTQPLRRASVAQIYNDYPLRSSDAKPALIAREGTNFIFGPYPDSTYTVKGVYYAKPTSIQSATNALFTAYPDLYLMAALCEAAPYIAGDTRIPVWEAKLKNIIMSIDGKEASDSASGAGLAVKAA